MARNRQLWAVIVVALAVVLAGCAGGGDATTEPGASPTAVSSAGSDAATPTPTSADGSTDSDGAVTATTTESPTPTPTPTSAGDRAATPTNGSGVDEALDAHSKALEAAGGYVATMTVRSSGSDSTGSFRGGLRADLTTDSFRWDLTTRTAQGTVTFETYRPPNSGTLFICFIVGGECSQRSTTAASESTIPDANPMSATRANQRPNFTDEGVVETENGSRHRYVADGVDSLPPDARSADWGSYESFRMELYFEPETGILRKYVIDATIRTDDETIESRSVVRITDARNVTVSAPEWYDG